MSKPIKWCKKCSKPPQCHSDEIGSNAPMTSFVRLCNRTVMHHIVYMSSTPHTTDTFRRLAIRGCFVTSLFYNVQWSASDPWIILCREHTHTRTTAHMVTRTHKQTRTIRHAPLKGKWFTWIEKTDFFFCCWPASDSQKIFFVHV